MLKKQAELGEAELKKSAAYKKVCIGQNAWFLNQPFHLNKSMK